MGNGIWMAGKALVLIGIMVIAIGIILMLGAKIPWLGRLPGDIYIKRNGFSFYFPLTTSVIISVIISLILIFMKKV